MIRRPPRSTRTTHSFPTRRSSDLPAARGRAAECPRRIGRLGAQPEAPWDSRRIRSEEHTSELQSLMRISYAVFCLKKKIIIIEQTNNKEILPIIKLNHYEKL